jgi:hypothetical protein
LNEETVLDFINLIVDFIQLKYDGFYLTKVSNNLKNIKPLWYFASEEFIKTSKILLLNDTVNEVDVIEINKTNKENLPFFN